MNKSLENFKKYLPLLQQFVKRDFKTKYRRSVLGILWSVLNPLGMMLVMTVVFSHLFRAGIENFPVYLMCGQLVFNFYNEASNSAMNSIIWNGALIKKVYIPKYLLPMSSVCTSLVNLLTSFIALIIVIVITRSQVSWTFLLVIVPVIYTWMFAYGMGMILCVLVTAFRDVQHLYGVIIVAWMYLTPIFYPVSMLPEWVAKIVNLNPLTAYVEMIRDVILYCQVPSLALNLRCLLTSVIVLLLGALIFSKKQNTFILKYRVTYGRLRNRSENVSLEFCLYSENVSSIKEYFIKKVKREISKDSFWALKDISFNVKKGEAVGLVGKNGCGKSTMLKTIAGVLTPTMGTVKVNGTVAPMIELGAGFDPELTARENIF